MHPSCEPLAASCSLPTASGPDSPGGALAFSPPPQPSIKSSNSQQLLYLFTLPDGGRRASRRRQLGCGSGASAGSHLPHSVGSTPSREVVAPLGHLARRAVIRTQSPGRAGCCPISRAGTLLPRRAETLPCPPLVPFLPGAQGRASLPLAVYKVLPWLDTSQGSQREGHQVRKATSILGLQQS